MGRRQERRALSRARPPTPAAAPPQPVKPAKRRLSPRGSALRRTLHRVARARPLLVVTVLVVGHLLLAFLTLEPRPHTGGDNAAYITLARSLIEHGTYTELWDPAEPPHTKYPPVFPGLLAIALLVGLKPWVQLKLVVIACSAAAVALTFLWIRARKRPLLALAIASIIAVAPGVLREGRWVLS